MGSGFVVRLHAISRASTLLCGLRSYSRGQYERKDCAAKQDADATIERAAQSRTSRLLIAALVALVGMGAASPPCARAQAPSSGTVMPAISKKAYVAASVHALPGLHCKLHVPGAAPSADIPVYTDVDGYARFYAVPALPADTVQRLTLDCTDPAGKPSSYLVDLRSSDTFAPRPLKLGEEQGTDRPALTGNPLALTQSQLIERGYGLRPDPAKDAAAYARWLASATRPGRMLEAKRPDTHSHTVTSIQSPWWVGAAITGLPDYISTEATFNVPTAIPGGDETTSTAISIWNGLGGFGTGSGLIQGGVNVQTTPTAAAYSSWREYCCGDPNSNGYGGAFVPNPGDQIYSQEWYCDARGNPDINGGYGCTFLHDLTSGGILSCTTANGSPCWSVQALPLCSASPDTANCMTLGAAAEFIIENQSPQVSASSTAFTDFTPAVTMSGSAYSSKTGGYSQTISTDAAVSLLTDFTHTTTHMDVALVPSDQTRFTISPAFFVGATIWSYTGTPCSGSSCPGWTQLDNNPATVAIAGGGNKLFQLHNDGKIWVSTGLACSSNSCPGWQMLDENAATVQIAADSSNLYQLHNTGKIWRYTGVPCNGNVCAGWQMLDDNIAAVQIAADSSNLYQLHNTGKIWRYTGAPCNGNACAGWQMLDDNPAAVGIVAGGGSLYQLHDDGSIWRYTGAPCSGASCPGWQMLDNNVNAVAIAAGSQLYQLHADGSIWRFTGTPCSGASCPGWQMLDNNLKAVAIAAAGGQVYEMHDDGMIWRYTGTPCSGASCPGWQRLDDNPLSGMIAAAGNLYQLHTDPLYQSHNDGSLWRYTGTDCNGNFCPGWAELDNNSGTVAMAAAAGQFYQLHKDGSIWRHNGTTCSGSGCPGWIELDNNPAARSIAAGGIELYQLHADGSIWRHTGTPCNGASCPGWLKLDDNTATTAITASETQLFQLHADGSIWRHNGTPCSGTSCPGWQKVDGNPAAKAIAAGNKDLFQLHVDGSIWRYTGTPCGDVGCSGWQELDNNPATTAIAAGGKELVQLHKDGSIWLYSGTPCTASTCAGWQKLDNNAAAISIATSGAHIYQRHNDGSIWRYAGPPCDSSGCPGWTKLDSNADAKAIAAGGFN